MENLISFNKTQDTYKQNHEGGSIRFEYRNRIRALIKAFCFQIYPESSVGQVDMLAKKENSGCLLKSSIREGDISAILC